MKPQLLVIDCWRQRGRQMRLYYKDDKVTSLFVHKIGNGSSSICSAKDLGPLLDYLGSTKTRSYMPTTIVDKYDPLIWCLWKDKVLYSSPPHPVGGIENVGVAMSEVSLARVEEFLKNVFDHARYSKAKADCLGGPVFGLG